MTNLLEDQFLEERRRIRIFRNAFGERPVLNLICATLIGATELWRGVRMGASELRQLKVTREELQGEYQQKNMPMVTASDRTS